jgi:DNA-binding NarL/FixJ family response regulator
MAARVGDLFVGRVRELDELRCALDKARAGNGSTVLVTGDAGIGKTRLASELARQARDTGFDVLFGRSMDLVGAELPYQPFVDALRPHGKSLRLDARLPGSQVAVFEEALARLVERAAAAPVLLVLEDLHWADSSTLDLVIFLAHHLDVQPVMLLATYRADEPPAADRLQRFAEGVRRSGCLLPLDLGPLRDEELATLLDAHGDVHLPPDLTDAIIARAEGNPFFAEELLAAAGDLNGQLPPGLRNLLLRRVNKLDRPAQGLLRLVAAAGRDVGYPVLRQTAQLPEGDLRESLRQAVEHGLLVAEQASGTFRFRHALLAEAIYATVLPGEREELHARLADELARSDAAPAAELAHHWAVAGRASEALVASVEAADQAEAVFGLVEAFAHLERALGLWSAVPDADRLAKCSLAELCYRTAELASQVGTGPRAVALAHQAIELTGAHDPHRAALLHVRLGEYLYEIGDDEAGLAALERAARLVPEEPPSAECAYALGSFAGGLMVAWRHADSLPIGQRALDLARAVGAGEAEVRALTVLGGDLVYLDRGEEGLTHLRQALRLAEEIGDRWGLERTYTNLTDALTMLGRPGESARVGLVGLETLRRYGIENGLLAANTVEALIAAGEWGEADRLSAAALRSITASFRYLLHMHRADLDIGRGNVEPARRHLQAALPTLRQDHALGVYDILVAELALCEHRWIDADHAVRDALALVGSEYGPQLRVWYCAKGLRAQAELAALARARRDDDGLQNSADRSRELVTDARQAAAQAQATTANAAAWLALAEAEYARACGAQQPESWSAAAAAWDRVERPPLAAYCRHHEAAALVAAGASRAEASVALRQAHAVATTLGAVPLLREIELLAQRTRIQVAAPDAPPARERPSTDDVLGLTAREVEVLDLLANGYTNREIAATLVISVRTASIHVSHILRKLGVPNRLEAAAVAHRLEAAAVAHRPAAAGRQP